MIYMKIEEVFMLQITQMSNPDLFNNHGYFNKILLRGIPPFKKKQFINYIN